MPVRPAVPAIEGDVGTIIVPPAIIDLDGLAVSLAGAAPVQVIAERPSGTGSTWAGAIHDAPNGLVRYTTLAGDLNEVGLWRIQARAVVAGKDLRGPIGTLRVEPKLDGV
jgi:hypothetical protein